MRTNTKNANKYWHRMGSFITEKKCHEQNAATICQITKKPCAQLVALITQSHVPLSPAQASILHNILQNWSHQNSRISPSGGYNSLKFKGHLWRWRHTRNPFCTPTPPNPSNSNPVFSIAFFVLPSCTSKSQNSEKQIEEQRNLSQNVSAGFGLDKILTRRCWTWIHGL